MSNNYAFIDSQNLNMATHTLGWNMDWAKFRAYLKADFQVEVAYLFMGYMPEHQEMYNSLQKAGYIVVFKPVSVNREGEVKGNIDAELVLQTMIDFERYDNALIVTGDGDFASLVSHLCNKNKLAGVLIPNQRQFSPLLKSAAKDKVFFINNLRRDLEYRRYNNNHKPAPRVESPESTKPESHESRVVSHEPPQPAISSASTNPASQTPAASSPSQPQAPTHTSQLKTHDSQLPTQDSKLTSRSSSQTGRLTSTRSIEDAIIQATSAPAQTSTPASARKPRPPRRAPKPSAPTSATQS